jgi:hypothetical protein
VLQFRKCILKFILCNFMAQMCLTVSYYLFDIANLITLQKSHFICKVKGKVVPVLN